MTQTEIILNHLQKYNTITSWEAIGRYGITRISARIWDLRKAGWEISVKSKVIRNSFGNKVNVAEYTLEGRKDELKK